jgi:hypothetical protein
MRHADVTQNEGIFGILPPKVPKTFAQCKGFARAFGGDSGTYVRMPGEGDVTALPLFRRGAEDSSLFYFWQEESVRFSYFRAVG